VTGRVLAVIPVRHAAKRFPGKPLADLGGRPVVEWVHDAAVGCGSFDDVVIATDSDAIAERARGFGAAVEMTRDDHLTGSDRVAEVAERHPEADVVVNVQGDQPFATSEMLSALVAPFAQPEPPEMTTLACPLQDPDARRDPNVVKVVCDLHGTALYFSRSPLPHSADPAAPFLHHLGLYAFSRDTLLRFPSFEPTPLEQAERLEQLRALEHGVRIRVALVERPVLEINTPEDLERANALVAAGGAASR
jgi:3-deoxy-manno-octulosonate cytidylyltransferase (CMP-KDO synthetase)